MAKRSCRVATITLAKTIRQEVKGLFQGTACSPTDSERSKNVEQELANDFRHTSRSYSEIVLAGAVFGQVTCPLPLTGGMGLEGRADRTGWWKEVQISFVMEVKSFHVKQTLDSFSFYFHSNITLPQPLPRNSLVGLASSPWL